MPDRAGARPYHGVERDLHGILMLTRMLAAAGHDFCGLATRFAVAWAFGALWFDFPGLQYPAATTDRKA